MFTPSDVSSLAESLSRWERGEYISEAFVIIACAGELVADLGRKCLTRAHRNRLERISTILLVAALSASLICLVRANELSGRLIGSLRDKAVEAAMEAGKALSDSTATLTQSGQAKDKADAAEGASGRAKNKADAASVKAEEVDAELGLAELLMSARSVQNRDELADKIKQQFKGRDVVLRSYIGDQEGWGLCTQLWYVAKSAEMNPVNQCGMAQLEVPLTSPFAISGPDVDETMKLADVINRIGRIGGWSAIKAPVLTIFVGAKSPFMIGQARGVKASTKKQIKKQNAKP